MTIRAAIYARVSTNGQDPEPQLAALKQYIQRRGWVLAAEYVDVASGKDDARPNLARMMSDAFHHEFDVVVVWKFDRFARSVSHLLRALEKFKDLKIEFVSVTEQLDTATPTGKLVFTILAAVGELERDLIRERVSLGMQAAKASGRPISRSAKAIDEKKVRTDYALLQSIKKVARLHGCGVDTVHRILHGKRLTPISPVNSHKHVN